MKNEELETCLLHKQTALQAHILLRLHVLFWRFSYLRAKNMLRAIVMVSSLERYEYAYCTCIVCRDTLYVQVHTCCTYGKHNNRHQELGSAQIEKPVQEVLSKKVFRKQRPLQYSTVHVHYFLLPPLWNLARLCLFFPTSSCFFAGFLHSFAFAQNFVCELCA